MVAVQLCGLLMGNQIRPQMFTNTNTFISYMVARYYFQSKTVRPVVPVGLGGGRVRPVGPGEGGTMRQVGLGGRTMRQVVSVGLGGGTA